VIPGYPDMMFNMGLADLKQKAVIQDYCDRTVAFINQGIPSPLAAALDTAAAPIASRPAANGLHCR
jgi:hypothetical protein